MSQSTLFRTNKAGYRRQLADPGYRPPSGTCDCHIHVLGPYDRHPLLETRTVDPPEAPLEAYRRLVMPLGVERVVVVQPSMYLYDNRATLEAVAALGPAARAVVVVAPEVTAAELAVLHRQGARGVRLQKVAKGGLGFEHLETIAAKVAPLGWHLQFWIDAREVPDLLPRLKRLPVPMVFDHAAKIEPDSGQDEPGFHALLDLLAGGGAWVKLGNPLHQVTQARARALFRANPERVVWGSDWPHCAWREVIADEGLLLADIARWFPDEADRKAVLAENPDRLYFR
jgi:predicted TIM-barrel fold metal-dependent hydrolase